jgi:hypothetical protein
VACVCSRGYVNGSRGCICRRLASTVGCGVAIAAADPGNLLEMAAPHRSRLVAATLLAASHHSHLAVASLLAASLFPPVSTWVRHLLAATLRACHVIINRARSRSPSPSRRTWTLPPSPLGWSQECRRCRRKLEQIILLNHVSELIESSICIWFEIELWSLPV